MSQLDKIVFTSLLLLSPNSYAVEITPLFGYRSGGDVIEQSTDQQHTIGSSEVYGVIISTPYEQNKTLELYYSHQTTRLQSVTITLPPTSTSSSATPLPLTLDYLHIGGTTPIQNTGNIKTFASGGLGVTYLNPNFAGMDSALRASFSVGIGLKWPLTNTIALRMEARGLATLFNNNSSIFCNGGCTLTVRGKLLIQGEVFAGLAIAF